MNFNFEETAGASQSNSRKQLEGNMIHDVIFDGCESRDFDGVQDTSRKFHVLELKFHNNDGVFTHTVWEPIEADTKDTQGAYGPQPSNVKKMMYLFKHLIDAVNPILSKKIDSKEEKIVVTNWNALRQYMIENTKEGIGSKTKIKLLKNNKGEAIFPYFLNYNRDGKLYMSTNFIGNNVFFTNKELDKIKKSETSKPTTMTSNTLNLKENIDSGDFNFDI